MRLANKLRSPKKNARAHMRQEQRKLERRAKAESLIAEYRKLTLAQKIARLPVGGARRQRVRLMAEMAA
jgi:hypothetical protein